MDEKSQKEMSFELQVVSCKNLEVCDLGEPDPGFRRDDGRGGERGNALVYILIAIALFAALSFTLGRQTDTGEAGALSEEKAELFATQLVSYAAQTKSAIDQMLFTGTDVGNLDFVLPTAGAFNTAPHLNKVYHPEGGGLNPGRLPDSAVTQSTADPVPGWYLGRFNNIEWTATAGTDVILVAYQINQQVCERINLKINGSAAIPTMGDSIRETMIDDAVHGGVNLDLTTDPAGSPICPDCHKQTALCVENQAQDAYGFYTIIADR